MKNSSTPFKPTGDHGGLFAASALWVFFSHGFDLVVLATAAGRRIGVAQSTCRHRRAHDPRMDDLQSLVTDVAAGKGDRSHREHRRQRMKSGQLCWHVFFMLDQLEACFREQQSVLRMASAEVFPQGSAGRPSRRFLRCAERQQPVAGAVMEDNAARSASGSA